MTALLTTEKLSIGYRLRRNRIQVVASDLNLELHAGELTCLVGGNGIGKSTLLRTLAGMQPPLAGVVLFAGQDLTTLRPATRARRIAVVLTDRVEIGHMHVYSLVGLGRHPYTGLTGRINEADHAKIRWAIAAVGADPLADRFVDELSDGERQKVMIARALAQDPALMLLDEPTAFLDLPHRMEIMRHLRRLAWDSERAVLVTTHDVDLALRTADRLWLFEPNGTLVYGAPEDLVLHGNLQQVFCDRHVEFDAETGTFSLPSEPTHTVQLTGSGAIHSWTQLALKRAGFAPVASGNNVHAVVHCRRIGATCTWESSLHGKTAHHASVYDLLRHLRRWLNASV
jgi:iron complex transport system ATP-binding protein